MVVSQLFVDGVVEFWVVAIFENDDDDVGYEVIGVFVYIGCVIFYFCKLCYVLMFKMDIMFVFWMFIVGFMKEMDQFVIMQVYVFGMCESLGLYGNEFVMFNMFFLIGYVFGFVLGQFVQIRIRLLFFFFICEVCWGFFVLL